MESKKMNWWQAGLVIFLSLVLAVLLARFIIYDFSSMEIFAPIEKKLDFQVSDIYNAVEEKKHVVSLSQDIIVVSVDECNREQTAEVINLISSYKPKAIGLDLSFMTKKANNDTLLNAVLYTPNLVNATKVFKPDTGMYYHRLSASFYEKEYDLPHIGYANLDAAHMWNIVRTFVPYVLVGKNDTLPSLAMELARMVAPDCVTQLLRRGNDAEIIDYTSCEIEVVTAERLQNDYVAKRLHNKVVLVGDTADTKDTYRTPLHDSQPGVLIHAYALQTILSGSYIDKREEWKNWLIAILIGFIFICLLLFANEYHAFNLIIRIGQFALMYWLIVRGCVIYSQSHIYADFTPAILMLGLGALSFDIIYALYGIIQNFIKILIKYRKK